MDSTSSLAVSDYLWLPQKFTWLGHDSVRSRTETTSLDFIEMLSQAFKDPAGMSLRNLALEFRKGEVNDVVVMKFLPRQLLAEFEPYLVEQINLVRSQPGSVGAKVEDLLLA